MKGLADIKQEIKNSFEAMFKAGCVSRPVLNGVKLTNYLKVIGMVLRRSYHMRKLGQPYGKVMGKDVQVQTTMIFLF